MPLAWAFVFTLFQAHWWKINSRQPALPPVASLPALGPCRKFVVVQDGANVFGRRLRKRVSLEQTEHLWGTLQQPKHKLAEPRRLAIVSQRREPHLPIQAWLKRCNPARGAVRIAYLVFEIVSEPGFAIIAALNHNLRALCGHVGKEAVSVGDSQRPKISQH